MPFEIPNKVISIPTEADWNSFYSRFHKISKLDLTQYKQDQLRRRILSMCETAKCETLEAFFQKVSGKAEDTQWFLDKLAINVSELYRNPEKWADLATQVLPSLVQESRSLKCWSAGCSYGAEAYSLATLLDNKFPGQHRIIGTDIDATALAQARQGEFNDPDMRGVPADIKAKYFTNTGPNKWKASEGLRKYLSFSTLNLLNDRFDANFDLILCRNVVIYFADDAKDRLYQRFFDALRPGGLLFLGSTERIFEAQRMGFETAGSFFYRKPKEAQKAWRNAS